MICNCLFQGTLTFSILCNPKTTTKEINWRLQLEKTATVTHNTDFKFLLITKPHCSEVTNITSQHYTLTYIYMYMYRYILTYIMLTKFSSISFIC
jgi:hypothetical protein